MNRIRNLAASGGAVFVLATGFSGNVLAAHYSPGTNGGAEGWVPPPGFNVRFDVIDITRDTLYDESENRVPVDFDLDVLATVPSFTYSTAEPVLLGARYGARLVVPFVDKHLQVTTPGGNIADPDRHALADMDLQPIMLGWGNPSTRYDSMVGVGFVLPTGDYDDNANKTYCGDGYYTAYLQGGANFYLDQGRSWYISGLFHLLFNGEQDTTETQIGDELVGEYGFGKTFHINGYMLRAGAAAYSYWKYEGDEPSSGGDTGTASIYGIGPEVELVIPEHKWSIEARYYTEFGADNYPEGEQFVLTFVKAF